MNIFATNDCPVKSAQDHCSVHCIKMIVELAQLLSTAHYELDGEQVGYKPTHKNHPCAIWVRETAGNYSWAYAHFVALCDEYVFRTGKVHKTAELIEVLQRVPANIPQHGRTPFAMAMPDQYKLKGIVDQTLAYKAYLNDKFKEWLARDKPMRVEWPQRGKPSWTNL